MITGMHKIVLGFLGIRALCDVVRYVVRVVVYPRVRPEASQV
jgi:hypothetical protein